MTVRDATAADAKRIAEVAQVFGNEEEFRRAIAQDNAVWVFDDDDGGACQIRRHNRTQQLSVGPLVPLDMRDDGAKAMALLKACLAAAHRVFSDARDWEITTYVPAANRDAADSFEAWFQADRRDEPTTDQGPGGVFLSLRTMQIAYERSQRWQV